MIDRDNFGNLETEIRNNLADEIVNCTLPEVFSTTEVPKRFRGIQDALKAFRRGS